jgi:hypothetical protein
MGMELHRNIEDVQSSDPGELAGGTQYDFLAGVHDQVIRMDEVHATSDDDSLFIYLIWIDPEQTDEDMFVGRIRVNGAQVFAEDGWQYEASSYTRGLIIVRAIAP